MSFEINQENSERIQNYVNNIHKTINDLRMTGGEGLIAIQCVFSYILLSLDIPEDIAIDRVTKMIKGVYADSRVRECICKNE